MTEVLHLPKQSCEHLLQQWIDKEHYDHVIDEDVDVYISNPLDPGSTSESNLVLKFRKRWFTKQEQEGAYDGLRDAAKSSQNRGIAAGPRNDKLQNRDWVTNYQLSVLENLEALSDSAMARISESDLQQWKAQAEASSCTRGLVWLFEEKEKNKFDFEEWLRDVLTKDNATIRKEARWVKETMVSDTSYANPVDSGVAGWFGRYPRIPFGRATSYTRDNPEKFALAFPFLQSLGNAFKELIPGKYEAQMRSIRKLDQRFYVPGTPFTTITVNKNFRTAAHRDAGDLAEGFSNLTVVARDKNYTGGLLVLPEIRAAVNIRPGDLLLVGNHEFIHGNTPILAPDVGELERISLVCYMREDMLDLGSWEYEKARYDFVEKTRKDKNRPGWYPRFNGVFPGMWESQEWYDFLKNELPEEAENYMPKASGSLEDFFV